MLSCIIFGNTCPFLIHEPTSHGTTHLSHAWRPLGQWRHEVNLRLQWPSWRSARGVAAWLLAKA